MAVSVRIAAAISTARFTSLLRARKISSAIFVRGVATSRALSRGGPGYKEGPISFVFFPIRSEICFGLRFSEKLEDQKLAERLRQQPSGTVDVLEAWFEHDPATLLKRAEEVLAGR